MSFDALLKMDVTEFYELAEDMIKIESKKDRWLFQEIRRCSIRFLAQLFFYHQNGMEWVLLSDLWGYNGYHSPYARMTCTALIKVGMVEKRKLKRRAYMNLDIGGYQLRTRCFRLIPLKFIKYYERLQNGKSNRRR